jgi:hypothetical protein
MTNLIDLLELSEVKDLSEKGCSLSLDVPFLTMTVENFMTLSDYGFAPTTEKVFLLLFERWLLAKKSL